MADGNTPTRKHGIRSYGQKKNNADNGSSSVDDEEGIVAQTTCYEIESLDSSSTRRVAAKSKLESDVLDISSSVDGINVDYDTTSESNESNEECLDFKATGGAYGRAKKKGSGQKINVETQAINPHLKVYNHDDDADDDDVHDVEKERGGDIKKDSPEKQGPVQETKICFKCGKKEKGMKTCSSCKKATYCNRDCQKKDWKNHKKKCGSLHRLNEKLDTSLFQLQYGSFEKHVSLLDIPNEDVFTPDYRTRSRRCVVLEIVDVYPHLFRPGCYVQDVDGKRTHILFYHTSDATVTVVRLSAFRRPPPHGMEGQLVPGRFICLFDPVWHYFLDGNVGIRINNVDEFKLL